MSSAPHRHRSHIHPEESIDPDPQRRGAFFSDLGMHSHFGRLFDELEGVGFFVKDAEGVLLFANRHLLHAVGLEQERQIIGKTDFDLHPKARAEKYRADDCHIMATAQPMRKIIEIFIDRQGIPGWFMTHKHPVLNQAGKVIGVMGVIQRYEDYRKLRPLQSDIQKAIDYVDEHRRDRLFVPDMASRAGLSIRELERKFHQHFNMTPQQYLIKVRVHEACHLIYQDDLSFAQIAHRMGFSDQSALSRQFKAVMGITPMQYRKQYV